MTTKVAISAPAFYRRDALFAPIEWFTNQARRCGADGIEWRPCQLPLTALQIAAGAISFEAKAEILSVEESYRTERSPWEAWNHDNRKIAMYSYFLFPHKDDPLKDSLFGIRRLRHVLAR